MKIILCLFIINSFNTFNYNQAHNVQSNIILYNNGKDFQTIQYTVNQNPIIQNQFTYSSNVQNQNVLNSNERNRATPNFQTLQYNSPNLNAIIQNQIKFSYNVPNQNVININERSSPARQQYNTNSASVQPQARALDRSSSTSDASPQQYSYSNNAAANRNILNSNTPTFENRLNDDDNEDAESTHPSTFQYQYSKGLSVHEAINVNDIVKPQVEYRKYSNYSTPNTPDDQYYQKFYNIYNYVENQGRQDLIQYEMESVNDDFNGRSIVAPGQYPHMAAIGFLSNEEKIEFKCGGSLISKQFVITAAHCCYLNGETPIIVKLGIINLKDQTGNSDPQRRAIKEIIVHPRYNATMTYHDIALLKLQNPVEFTKFVRPILLWSSDHIPYERVFTMGYGSTSFAKAPTNILTELSLSIIPWQKCKQTLPRDEKTPHGIVETQICGRDLEKNRDTCQGDSGGPLQLNLEHRKHRNTYRYYLVGIISYGEFCGSKQPGVYTRVSSYCKWIASIVWPDYFQK